MKFRTISRSNYGFVCLLPVLALFFSGCETPAPLDNSKPFDVAHLHVGDTVTVTYSGIPDQRLPHEESIKENGTITLDDIGPIQAAGLTLGQLQNEIYTNYVPRYFNHLNVVVTSTSDRVYYVQGEVAHPGEQPYRGDSLTVTRAIAAAGDFTDFAKHTNVLLIRSTGDRIRVNCDKVLDGEAVDPPVYPGDQIKVSRRIW